MSKRLTRRGVLATAGAAVIAGPALARPSHFARVAGGSSSAPITGGTPFITGVTPGTPTGTGSSEAHGFQFTPAVDIAVTALGRYAVSGNSQTHTVSIFFGPPGSSQALVTGASAVVNMSGATPGTFVYAPLSSNVVLWAGQSYFILSTETTGGDSYLNNDTVVTTTADAVLNDSVAFNNSVGYITYGGSGVNKPFVPVNFKYNVGAPGNLTLRGAKYPPSTFQDAVAVPLHNNSPIVTGAAYSLFVAWVHGPVPSETITYQWILDYNTAISPVLTSTNPGLPYSWDSTSVADGTHTITCRILDGSVTSIFNLNVQGRPIIVANSGFNNATQTVPVVAYNDNRSLPARPDTATYTAGTPYPTRATYPMPYTFIAGSNSALLRDSTKWYGEAWPGPRTAEYWTSAQWATTPSGGVRASFFDPLFGTSVTTQRSYDGVVNLNTFDGTRLNALVTAFTTFVEDPAGGGKWWGVEINGRVFNITHDGTVTTVIGRVRDRTQPTYDPYFPGLTESQIDTKITNVGTLPGGVSNLGGANDLCFDPTDANILYVACQVDNWIARINIATQIATIYAGSPGAADGYTGDGGPAASATFAQPSSIIMDGSRIMYVCDSQNSAIRKIVPGGSPSVAGNITTLCGGATGPSTTGLLTAMAGGIAYPVGSGSITWNSGTLTGAVVMQNPTTIKLGYTLNLSGATSSPDPNSTGTGGTPRYVVTAFTDSQHFTIGFEPTPGGKPAIATGAITGALVLTTHNADIYSSPTPVTFTGGAGWVPFPNVIRFTSAGNIVVGEPFNGAARLITLGTSTITRVGLFTNYLDEDPGQQWYWLDVDTAGMCGPVDDVLLFKVQNGINGAHDTWRISLDGTYAAEFFSDGYGIPTYAPVNMIQGGPGHYPWAIAISKHEGRWIGTGMAQFQPCMGRIKQVGDPDVTPSGPNFNASIAESGSNIYIFGTAAGFPPNLRPSFWSLRGSSGASWMTGLSGADTFEDLMATYPTDGALGAYIQAGMGGSVPRPEIVGNHLRDLIYQIRRGTLQGSLPTPYQPGADDPNNETPIILTCSAVRNSATQITVNWTTDIPSIGMAAAGAPGNFGLGIYSLFSEIENSYGTSHSVPVQVLTGVSPVHFIVNCMSAHGIFAHTIDLTVS